jgi:hypothetical protein
MQKTALRRGPKSSTHLLAVGGDVLQRGDANGPGAPRRWRLVARAALLAAPASAASTPAGAQGAAAAASAGARGAATQACVDVTRELLVMQQVRVVESGAAEPTA